MESNLCLGTAQLGNIYGITNKKGKISDNHINKILDSAIKKEITFFDTAHAYGDAEKKIGKYLKNKNINVISKFSTGVKKIFKDNDINVLEDNFQQSLKRLNRKYLFLEYQDFAENTENNIYKICKFLKTNKSKLTKKIMKRERFPRIISNSIYKENLKKVKFLSSSKYFKKILDLEKIFIKRKKETLE